MKILSIESSCDETAAAIIEDGRCILANQVYTQIAIHRKYGGVVPEIASRNHVMKMPYVVQDALDEAQLTFDDLDAIAVTKGPGLVGALLVGVSEAKALAYALDKPLIGVNHIEGHIAANYLAFPELEPPFLALIVSGGHTNLVIVKDYGTNIILGRTRDDAAGEAFDKVARVLGYPYPGGPAIDQAAQIGDAQAIDFPRVMLEKDSYDFSFSGLKSAVLNELNHRKMKNIPYKKEDVAASFQAAVLDVLTEKTIRCAEAYGMKKIVIAGGVSANKGLRTRMDVAAKQHNWALYYPPLSLCTDNAAMIGARAYYDFKLGRTSSWDLNAVPGLELPGLDRNAELNLNK
ncbi:tRNA (adenosine(37)-N6)-threonylcarbamoyltransferase complex transferase subunit TsaD [Pseudoramibacter porci]|nr:tRNA (adenosine(37)-N6)-threonylcarbamoyltransferase complex transferase subunit TsaD [Pseudoramibacter porci]